jgi:hypothetical protein
MEEDKISSDESSDISNVGSRMSKISLSPSSDSDSDSDFNLSSDERSRAGRSSFSVLIDLPPYLLNIFYLSPIQYGFHDTIGIFNRTALSQEEAGPPPRIFEHPSWRMPGKNLFFTLPREIRDQIYRWVLLPSSTPYLIEPYQIEHEPLSKRKKKAKHRGHASSAPFKICLDPVNLSPSEYHTPERVALSRHGGISFNYTTLSLLHTNKQIYEETRDLFWHNVIFYFPQFNFCYLQPENRVVRVLKGMGQTASRLIRHIRIRFNGQRDAKGELPKFLRLLASRARLGEFKLLELTWSAHEFYDHVYSHMEDASRSLWDRYDTLLGELKIGTTDCGYEIVIRFDDLCIRESLYPIRWGPTDMAEDDTKETIQALHFACGGSVYFEDKLLWQNYQKVNDISRLCPPRPPVPHEMPPLPLPSSPWTSGTP